MEISIGGLAKAREDALARLAAHFNEVAARNAHDDALDLRLRISGKANGSDPVLAREAERQAIADRIAAFTSIDEVASLVADWDENGVR